MRLLLAALAALPLSAAAAHDAQPPDQPLLPAKRTCSTLVNADTERPKARVHRLTELPPAEAYFAVHRINGDGCPDPLLVGYRSTRRR